MTQRLFLDAHTIDDKIVLDAISSVNRIRRGKFVNGGMAVQTYVSSDLWRKTTDLDITTTWHGRAIAEFREFLAPLSESLASLGYEIVGIKKKDQTFDVRIQSTVPDGQKLLIQFPRKSPSNYEKMKDRLQREMSNVHQKDIGEVRFPVLAPEDIILRKVYRIILYDQDHGVRVDKKLYEADLAKLVAYIRNLREELFSKFDNVAPHELTALRAHSDTLDVLAIKQAVKIDPAYFREGRRDYQKLSDETDSRVKTTLENLRLI